MPHLEAALDGASCGGGCSLGCCHGLWGGLVVKARGAPPHARAQRVGLLCWRGLSLACSHGARRSMYASWLAACAQRALQLEPRHELAASCLAAAVAMACRNAALQPDSQRACGMPHSGHAAWQEQELISVLLDTQRSSHGAGGAQLGLKAGVSDLRRAAPKRDGDRGLLPRRPECLGCALGVAAWTWP